MTHYCSLTRCSSALHQLQFRSFRSSCHQSPISSMSAVDCLSTFHRRFAQRLSVTFPRQATLFVRALLVRSSWRSMSRPSMALHGCHDEVHLLLHARDTRPSLRLSCARPCVTNHRSSLSAPWGAVVVASSSTSLGWSGHCSS